MLSSPGSYTAELQRADNNEKNAAFWTSLSEKLEKGRGHSTSCDVRSISLVRDAGTRGWRDVALSRNGLVSARTLDLRWPPPWCFPCICRVSGSRLLRCRIGVPYFKISGVDGECVSLYGPWLRSNTSSEKAILGQAFGPLRIRGKVCTMTYKPAVRRWFEFDILYCSEKSVSGSLENADDRNLERRRRIRPHLLLSKDASIVAESRTGRRTACVLRPSSNYISTMAISIFERRPTEQHHVSNTGSNNTVPITYLVSSQCRSQHICLPLPLKPTHLD